jgi:tRNA A37 N6-isopentenylltransferase MiaA
VQECAYLFSLGLRSNACSATRAIGYRQALTFLEQALEDDALASTEGVVGEIAALAPLSHD